MKLGGITRYLGLDLRSLALFRVALAGATLADLACRVGAAHAFYSDAGLLPRAAQLALADPASLSLHLAGGATGFILALLLIQCLLALMVLAGARTRLATTLSFVLLVSLNARNPLVLLPGDALLAALWFWALFLPLSARWSLDAALSHAPAPALPLHRSWGAAGLALQLALAVAAAFAFGDALAPAPLVVGLLALLPGRAWDLAARATDTGRRLRVYYDRDCAFCRRACELLCHFLVVPRAELLHAQEQQRIRTLMETRNSWVVVDAEDVAHTKWRAFVALLRHSLLLRPLAPLAGLAWWERPGDALYDFVSGRRRFLGALVQCLPHAEGRFVTGPAAQRLALAFLVLLPLAAAGRAGALPAVAATPVSALFVALGMGPPAPAPQPRLLIVAGRSVDGQDVNVLEPGAALFEPPARTAPARWLAFYGHLDDAVQAERYAAWLCQRRSAAGGLPALESLRLIELVRRGSPPAWEQQILWRGDCPAP